MKYLTPTLALLLSLALTACSSGGGTGTAGGGGGAGGGGAGGTGTLTLTATDAPFVHAIVADARVAVTEVRVNQETGDAGWITLYDGAPIALNLLDLTNGVTQGLVSADVPAGTYRQIRLIIEDAYLRLENGNEYQVSDGTLKLTSLPTSGLKLFLDPPAAVLDGVSTELLLDFDLTKTFLPQPANDPETATSYKVLPVIHVANLSESGEVSGTVTADDGLGGAPPAPDATVYLLPPGETDVANAISTTMAGPLGQYALLGVAPGSYDVFATLAGQEDRVDAILVGAGSVTDVDLFLETP